HGAQDRARERGLAGAELAFERDEIAGLEACGNARAERPCCRYVRQGERPCKGLRILDHRRSFSRTAAHPQPAPGRRFAPGKAACYHAPGRGEGPTDFMQRIAIIGAGQPAAQAVATLRAEGFAGQITKVGDETYAPYQRPPLSKTYLMGEMERERLFL